MPKEDEKVEDQNVNTEEDEETGTDSEENEEEETVESLKAKLAEKEAALKKANRERARLGNKLKAPADKAKEETPTLTDAAKKAFVIADLKLKGLDDSQARKFARLVDLSDIDLDDDGNVLGIDTDEIEEDFPELFKKSDTPASTRKTVRKVDSGDKSKDSAPPTAWSDATKLMLGKSRR